ncbi:MAG: hypothetical protein IJU11_07020 [Prevotella sp.]|nr:hypothetical protein [Prevotella sp.]
MKKTYMQPEMTVFDMNITNCLLAGSGTVTETRMGFGGDAGDEEEGSARGFSFDED